MATFRVGDSWCRARTIDLRSGVRVTLTDGRFDPSCSFVAEQPAAEVELVASKGAVLRACARDGSELDRGGTTLQIGSTRRAYPITVRPAGDAPLQCVSVSMSARRLRELLGVPALPKAFRSVVEIDEPHALASRAMTPAAFRVLEEMVGENVRGAHRALWYEAKALELVALMTEAFAADPPGSSPLSVDDFERLDRVREALVGDLAVTPTLVALARSAGLSPTRFKSAFRARFGDAVFAHLRKARMREAQRLLLGGRGVTDVASSVGYANPSKFAAAFRRHFGISPSEATTRRPRR